MLKIDHKCYTDITEEIQFCMGWSQFYEKIIVQGLLVQAMLRAKIYFLF